MVRKALKKIQYFYKAGQEPKFENEFKILEKRFTGELEIIAIKWIKNFYNCEISSFEAFTYLESKL